MNEGVCWYDFFVCLLDVVQCKLCELVVQVFVFVFGVDFGVWQDYGVVLVLVFSEIDDLVVVGEFVVVLVCVFVGFWYMLLQVWVVFEFLFLVL